MPQRQQGDAETVAAIAALPAGDFNAATLQLAWRLAWDALARSHPDIDRANKLFAIVYKAEAHALALKRLALEERRVAVREKQAAAKLQATAAEGRSVAPSEANSPRCTGYSEPVRSSGEVRESAEMGGRDEGAEIPTKAQRSEGLSKGSEEAAPLAPVTGAAGDREMSLRGMTCAQVVAAWGEPHLRAREMKDFQRSDFWVYHAAAGEKRVYFERGVVVRCSPSAPEKKANLLAQPGT